MHIPMLIYAFSGVCQYKIYSFCHLTEMKYQRRRVLLKCQAGLWAPGLWRSWHLWASPLFSSALSLLSNIYSPT